MKKTVLLVSGGVESLVISALFRFQNPKVDGHAFHVNYRQKPELQEREAVQKTSRKYGLTYLSVNLDLPFLFGHGLMDRQMVILDSSYAKEAKKQENYSNHIVHYRNMAFLSLAAMYAATIEAQEIWTGFDWTDHPGAAKDKSPLFVEAMQAALREGGPNKYPKIVCPLQGKTKAENIQLGIMSSVDWKHSWSCYNTFERPCGVCGSCVQRLKGFEELNTKDPVKYHSKNYIFSKLGDT